MSFIIYWISIVATIRDIIIALNENKSDNHYCTISADKKHLNFT